jgi:hypothetical protein
LDAAPTCLSIRLPKCVRLMQLHAQCRGQEIGKHHHPIFSTLACTHSDHTSIEIDILSAQLESLGDAQARAVQQLRQ